MCLCAHALEHSADWVQEASATKGMFDDCPTGSLDFGRWISVACRSCQRGTTLYTRTAQELLYCLGGVEGCWGTGDVRVTLHLNQALLDLLAMLRAAEFVGPLARLVFVRTVCQELFGIAGDVVFAWTLDYGCWIL